MRSEQEMLTLVRAKTAHLRRRRRLTVLGATAVALAVVGGGGLSLAAAIGNDHDARHVRIVDAPASDPSDPSDLSEPDDTAVPTTTAARSPAGQTIIVPNVIGLDADQATTVLVEVGLDIERRSGPSSDVPFGLVISQSPAAGTTIAAGGTVVLDISAGGP